MNKIYKLFTLLFIAAFCNSISVYAQTPVYFNDFTGGTAIPAGTPATTFSSVTNGGGNCGAQVGGSDGVTSFTANQLAQWTTSSSSSSDYYIATTAPIYPAPFNATLSANTSLLTWTFNMRVSVASSGFGFTSTTGTDQEAAVVLAASNAAISNNGNGYAVAYNPNTPKQIRLVRYANGLQGAVTNLLTATNLGNAKNYASVKVTYAPTTNTWTLVARDDGNAAFANPAAGAYGAVTTVVNATYTGTAMNAFGFYSIHQANSGADNFSYFDNFQLTVNCTGGTPILGSTALCPGSTITLSNATAGGTWSSSNTGVATVVAGPATTTTVTGVATAGGTSVISYTLPTGCFSTTTVTVYPTPAAISGTTSVCAGSTTQLSNSVAGTWVSGATGFATIGNTTGLVNGIAAGVAPITFTSTATTCTVSTNVTVMDVPTTISGPTQVCSGSTITLSADVAGGTWTSSNPPAVSVVMGPSATTTATGLGSVVASSLITYSNGCGSPTITVNVGPGPGVITGIMTICANGGTTILGDPISGGVWSSSNTNVATVDATGIVTGAPFTGASNTVVISYSTGCGIDATATVDVDPAPGPISGPSTVCIGLTIPLADAALNGTWSSSSTIVASVDINTGVVTGESAGTATITYVNACGSPVTHDVTVNALPDPVSGPPSVCISYMATMTDPTPSGVWSTAQTSIASIDPSTGIVTGISGGDAIITYTDPSTTCINTGTITVLPPLAPISGVSSICVGQVTTLSISSIGGAWSSGNTAVAAVGTTTTISGTDIANVAGIDAGVTDITYTVGAGCSSILTLTVNPTAAITGTDSLCIGATTYLANIVGGGTWSSSATTVATIDSVNGFTISSGPGRSVIMYTTLAGCVSTATMTIIAYPPTITGTMNACPGLTTALADGALGGVWSSDNTAVATISNTGVVHGIFADTVTVNYTVRPGCATQTLVTINPAPAPITGNIAACQTTTDTLHDATPGGTWSTTTPLLATINDTSGVAVLLSGGNAIIVYTLPITGCKAFDTVLVHPTPIPAITFDYMAQALYADTPYVQYQWYDSLQGLIPLANSPNLAALYTEYYYVVVIDQYGCIGQSPKFHFDVTWLSVGNLVNAAAIKVYPNPSSATVYIESPVAVRAVISGIDGKQLLEQPNAREIDIRSLADGMYFITLYDDQSRALTVRKLIKQ